MQGYARPRSCHPNHEVLERYVYVEAPERRVQKETWSIDADEGSLGRRFGPLVHGTLLEERASPLTLLRTSTLFQYVPRIIGFLRH